MSSINKIRKSCKDVFNAFLVTTANYCGLFEFPKIEPVFEIPNRLISFSKCISCKDYDQWIHFYEDDYLFERLWKNPKKYLTILKKYRGVILPDFSLYRDMPLVMQLWNIYRSRAIGNWLQRNGVKVIPNLRFGDKRTYKVCCDGISKHSIIAIGTHGSLKIREDRKILMDGLDSIISYLKPSVLIIYGKAPDSLFAKYKKMGIKVISFDSAISSIHQGAI